VSTLKVTDIQHPSAVDPAIELDAAGKLWLAGGKILQIVRATDSTDRSTTSTTAVDASISVTITPQKDDSAVLLIWSALLATGATDTRVQIRITDSSNNSVSPAELGSFYVSGSSLKQTKLTHIGYATPATIASVTYKGRFNLAGTATAVTIQNSQNTGQLFAIEVSA
jgi:hypothetical protein